MQCNFDGQAGSHVLSLFQEHPALVTWLRLAALVGFLFLSTRIELSSKILVFAFHCIAGAQFGVLVFGVVGEHTKVSITLGGSFKFDGLFVKKFLGELNGFEKK